jgi:tRNA-2-methylthio-N6-dimethylallyladenosine synthase
VSSGTKDVTLLGQNVNEYKHETIDFTRRLEHVTQIPGVFRIRFLTSHPKDFSKKTIDVVKANPKICEWFHLPLQSGSNRILEMMNRKYTREQYLELVEYIREQIPHSAITTDIIAGFPTETEEEFNETISLLEEVRFDDAYMYRYSTRPGTEASSLESLDEETIGARLRKLIDFQHTIVKEKTRNMIGKEYEILFEGAARARASRGKTRGNKDVVVQKLIEPGEIRNVAIKEVKGHTPIGELRDT